MLLDDIVQRRLTARVEGRIAALKAERDAFAKDAQAQVDAFVRQAEAEVAHYNAGIAELSRLIAPAAPSAPPEAADTPPHAPE